MKREGFNVIGQPGLRDKQSNQVISGQLAMADDVYLGTKLFAHQLGSPHAHCRVVSIDTSKALALPGVEAVLTHLGDDAVPGWSEEKYFVNDPVAIVAATSPNIAMEACQLIDVEYETRPAVIDIDEAIEEGSPLAGLWPESNTNVRTEIDRGNLDDGFNEATVIVEYDHGYSNEHAPPAMGGGSCTAWWTAEDEANIFVDTQNIHSECRGVASTFGLPYNKVKGWTKGNGTGMGSGRAAVIPQAVALAKKTRKVVSFHCDRKIQQMCGGHQFALKSHTKIGAKDDGTITAFDLTYWGSQGMNSRAPITGAHQCWEHIFPVPNAHIKGIGVATNTTNRWHYR